MHGFEYFVPTEIVFGAGSTEKLPELLKKRGLSRVLVVYGGSSAKKSGLLDRVFRLLDEAGVQYRALGGVQPNPRVALAREALGDIDGVEVLPFTGLLVDFAREQGAGAVVKGLRAMTDFEYELQQADLNYRLDSELESIFVMSAPQYGYISSSVVRQIASLGSDVSTFVPSNVVEALKHRFS